MANAVAATTTGTNASGKKVRNILLELYILQLNYKLMFFVRLYFKTYLSFIFRHIPVRRVGIPPPVGMACLSITIPFT